MSQNIDLFNIYNNLIEFIKYRNLVLNDDILEKSDFEILMYDQNYIKYNLNDNMIILFFNYNDNVNSKFISDIIKKNKNHEIIIITKSIVLKTLPINVKNYFYKHFKIIVPNHILVPKYKILNDEEKNKVLNKWLIAKTSNLMLMNDDDAMAIWTGAKVGDILSEEYQFKTSGYNIDYRLVKKK